MATVVRHPDGKKWIADYRTPEGKRKRRVFKTKAEASQHLAGVEASKRGGVYVDPSAAKGITVHGLHVMWMKRLNTKGARGTRPIAASTSREYEKIYRLYIRPVWEYRPIGAVRRLEVDTWASELKAESGAPASDSAKAKALKQFSRMFDFAVTEGLLERNPARDRAGRILATPTPKPARAQVRLTMRQLVRLADACGEYRTLVLFVGTTGLRWGEVSTVRGRHLELGPRPSVAVDAQHAKNYEARIVPIPATVAALLEQRAGSLGPDDYLFQAPRGGRLNQSNFLERTYDPARRLASQAVGELQRAMGVVGETRRVMTNGRSEQVAHYGERTQAAVTAYQKTEGLEVTGIVTRPVWAALGLKEYCPLTLALGDTDFMTPTFHNLRHTAVSLAISLGANIKVVQRIAGHKTAAVTLDVYGDLFEADLFESAACMDAALRHLLEEHGKRSIAA